MSILKVNFVTTLNFYEQCPFFLSFALWPLRIGSYISSDSFGNTPLLEALKNGHDRVSSLLVKEGASLKIDNAGSFLCTAVSRGDSDFLKRILANDIDPNSKDYDHRTPLHIAASEGLYLMAKLLLEAGASVFSKDRYHCEILFNAAMKERKQLLYHWFSIPQMGKHPTRWRQDVWKQEFDQVAWRRKGCSVVGFPLPRWR